MMVCWDDRLELAWRCEFGESGEKLGLVIGLDIGLGRRVELSEAESDVAGERGPKPSIGGFFGLTFAAAYLGI